MRILTTTILMAALAAFSFAAGTPDFSGKWKLNVDKSEFPEQGGAGIRKPTSMDREVTQTDGEIHLKSKTVGTGRDGNPATTNQEFTYKLDGSETTAEGGRGGPVKIKAHFEGKKLMVESIREFKPQGETIKITNNDEWSLSNDGKVLTVNSTFSTPMGDTEVKFVFDKVE